jgi:hypothetical protein
MGQVKQPKIWSSVPKGQKVATLNLEISPSNVHLYKKSKNCAKKKKKKAPISPPLSLPTRKKVNKSSKKSPFKSAQKKVKKMFQKCARKEPQVCPN